jgi:hypothetical protein
MTVFSEVAENRAAIACTSSELAEKADARGMFSSRFA